jgi:hypothetical protein
VRVFVGIGYLVTAVSAIFGLLLTAAGGEFKTILLVALIGTGALIFSIAATFASKP